LELDTGTGKVLHRIPVAAEGTDHTRYALLRATPEGRYLVGLRTENRFVEVARDGEVLRSFRVPSLPIVAQRLADGSTLCSGRLGVIMYDAEGKQDWSFTRQDAAPDFPLIIAAGAAVLPGGRLLVVNSDWHYSVRDANRVQLFTLDADHKVSW